MSARENIIQELKAKPRSGWERNGFEDGLAGRDDRVPYGKMSVRDTYLVGWRDGDQLRRMVMHSDGLSIETDPSYSREA